MKKMFLAGLAAGLMTFGMSGMAQAYFISDGTNVGDYDTLRAATNKNIINDFNGADDDNKVLAWVNSVLNPDTTFAYKTEFTSYTGFQPIFEDTTSVSGGYAFKLATTNPEYFLIKTGGGVTLDENSYFLFANNINMQWAVFNLRFMGFNKVDNITGISHIDEYGGSNSVPEPGAMLLVGTGVVGFIVARRKKKVIS